MSFHHIVIRLLKPLINSAARNKLTTYFDPEIIQPLLENVWSDYAIHKDGVNREPNFGARIMVDLAILSRVFYWQLLQRTDEQIAYKIFNEIAWAIYSKMGTIVYRLTGLISKNKYDHLLRSTRLFRVFPFSSPSYQWKDLPSEHDVVAFNCERCPVANYFRECGDAHIGFNTWCQLDYRLAELWGGKLLLTNTISGGATFCDFKWEVSDHKGQTNF